jgi:hypothetical protein
MNPDLSKKACLKIKTKIESLCGQGCTRVNQIINDAKNGNKIGELSGFNRSEINQIIDELSQIMSVYDDDDDSNLNS